MEITDKWDNLSQDFNYHYHKIKHKNIYITFCLDERIHRMKVFLTEEDKCNIPGYCAPLLYEYTIDEINFRKEEIIEELVNKIEDILNPKVKEEVEAIASPDAKPQFCPCCGAPRKRNELKCPYCDIEFF